MNAFIHEEAEPRHMHVKRDYKIMIHIEIFFPNKCNARISSTKENDKD